MILLLGGTSDTAPVAEALARAGYRVLVSTATEIELFVGSHPWIERRMGRMKADEMATLIRVRGIRAIVDATHPYASAVRATAAQVAEQSNIPYLNFLRPGSTGDRDGVCLAADHKEAARLACEIGRPILLTIGSRNVLPYAAEARRAEVALIARVLDHPDSHKSCREAGIPSEHVLIGRGPFSVEENRRVIRQYQIGVLVTKDSGDAGGVREKLEAARLEGIQAIVVGRPEQTGGAAFDNIVALVGELQQRVPADAEPSSQIVLALDLESVLVPEIWETVARVAGVPGLNLTTRDVPDYGALMRQRISLCREHGLTLTWLREIVAAMEPLPGAREFLAWARGCAHVAIISDTFHELAGPLVDKLGSPLMICNALALDSDGFIANFTLRDAKAGKAGAVAAFQRSGSRVIAVGDSFNDLGMLQAADVAFLFRPAPRILEAGVAFQPLWTFDELQTAISATLL